MARTSRSSSRGTSADTPVTPSRDTSAQRRTEHAPGTKQTPKKPVPPVPMYMIGTHANVVPPPSKGDTKDGDYRG
jgi:hypothetical protein